MLSARLAVGVVLLFAGAAKTADRTWPATAAAFGAPAPVARLLPGVELALGGLLVTGFGLPWTAWAAFTLLGAFTAAVAVRVVRHDRVPCGCFGELSAEPVGVRTLVRNLVLCVLAALAARPGASGGLGSVLVGVGAGLLLVAASRPGRARRR